MLKEERQHTILNEVELHNRVLLTDLAEKLDVSIDTVRRDVKELDSDNRLVKVHGGAVSLGFANHSPQRNNNVYSLEEKISIAQKATSLLKDNSVILIDGGTTCLELARLLPANINLTCFTLSLPVAMELLSKPNVETIFIGGALSKDSQIAMGANAIHNLSQIKVDYSFIGTGYVDAAFGLTEFDWDTVQTKKAVIQASKKTVLLCISEKLNSQHRFKTCDLNMIDTMITELPPDHPLLESFKNQELFLL
ncbi:DeoR/GlpR family DNA-binding transcription regulator [Muricauda sp. 2012CJ35-5]|uniref:DeoR/GlpR family DNA-binding transcription regulator n=1 Tax=Flagellimonas spongiicola TaxID=2942208 RepID=A0ABT0PNB1_9FLAO|nr:DeoR/GlpR family DNA-binding transcription regulator [Allomuricauda spongiicola]MCL6272877.1 DeoR/GlpR family DNA-binding transcription regulator [Allomuricauda spongiicola]